MDLRQLGYFIAVAEERHLRRAAERLHLSQPPLTRHIKALEAELGVELFTRTPRGMLLTDAGETLLQDAYSVLGLLKAAGERARLSGQGKRGRLDVGLYGSATFGAVPDVLHDFKETHPDVEIHLHYAQTPAQVVALRQGRVSIVFERLLPRETDIEVELFAREPLVLAMSCKHRLASYETVDIGELRNEVIRVGNAPAEAAKVVELCKRHGFEPHFAVSSDVIMSTLLTTIGSEVSLVPLSMTNVNFRGVRYIPIKPEHDAFMDVHCYYLKKSDSPLLEEILKVVRNYKSNSRAFV